MAARKPPRKQKPPVQKQKVRPVQGPSGNRYNSR